MITIVGQAPGRRARGEGPLGGACGRRLARLAGFGSFVELRQRAKLVNLLDRFPGKNGRGDAFPMIAAIETASAMKPRGVVLLAGKNVAAAFGFDGAEFFEWRRRGTTRFAVIPHPSGLSRWWNDPFNVTRAAAFLREVFRAASS